MPHIHEKIDITAEAFIVYDNKVLLREHDKYHFLLGVGGHVELDEDPNEAVIREVKEEVGLEIELSKASQFSDMPNERELLPPKFMNRHYIDEKHEHVTLIYFAKAKTDKIVQGIGEKSDNVRWFTREELEDPKLVIKQRIRHYALKALEELGK